MNTSVISLKFNFGFLLILNVTAMGLGHFGRGTLVMKILSSLIYDI